jgi:hypothetical protein
MTYPNFYQGGYYPQYQNGAVPDMLNQFKGQYQQIPMQQPMMQQPIQQMPMVQTSDDRIWVQGEAGAKAYFVAANATVVLWDTESPTLYIKSADATGKPLEMDIIDLSRRAKNLPAMSQNPPTEHKCTCGDKFVLKKDFEALQIEFDALRRELEALKEKTKAKTTKKAVEEVENE